MFFMMSREIYQCLTMLVEEKGDHFYEWFRPLYFKRPLVPTMTDVPLRLSQPPIQPQSMVQNQVQF